MATSNGGTVHVVPNRDGGWNVIQGNSGKIYRHFNTKQAAIDFGRKISRGQNAEFIVHNKDGSIAQKYSHGNDPSSIPG